MPDVIILQRVVAHYRLHVFERLWQEFGWVVVAASDPPSDTHLNLVKGERDFIKRYKFRFPDPSNPFRCGVPLRRILLDTRARAVIAEFSLHMSSTYELAARRCLLGAPITLFWSHGYNMERGFSSPQQRLFQLPRIALSVLADAHVCYSAEGKAFLKRYMTSEELFVARNTLDVVPLQSLAEQIAPLQAPGRPSLLTIGRITADKDFPRLVRVFKEFRRSFPEAVLTIVGDGPDAEGTRAEAGDALGHTVFMQGAVYDEMRLAHYYRSSDLVVFPGAVGLSVNHALAYGVPVMAFDRTPQGPHHHPEIAYVVHGVTGYRIPHYSDAALLKALCTLFSQHPDPKSDFKEPIRRFVAENLTLDVMVKDFRKVHEYLKRLGIDGGGRATR